MPNKGDSTQQSSVTKDKFSLPVFTFWHQSRRNVSEMGFSLVPYPGICDGNERGKCIRHRVQWGTWKVFFSWYVVRILTLRMTLKKERGTIPGFRKGVSICLTLNFKTIVKYMECFHPFGPNRDIHSGDYTIFPIG